MEEPWALKTRTTWSPILKKSSIEMPTTVPTAKPRAKDRAVRGSGMSSSTRETANTQIRDSTKEMKKDCSFLPADDHRVPERPQGDVGYAGKEYNQGQKRLRRGKHGVTSFVYFAEAIH